MVEREGSGKEVRQGRKRVMVWECFVVDGS